ncbi:hypothetical protein [Serratia fonticola]|uniref:hypothetical protein n=1 Tax=Serratia fonticola TaxID=47917 RepID=UPI000BA2523F|nr:hypothetical protein [Serratia fonticola]PAA95463.1 hypothetical protein CJJ13_22115 [Serratia fonticola]
MKKSVIATVILTALIFSGGVMSSTLKQFVIEYSVSGKIGKNAEIVFASNINDGYTKLKNKKKSNGESIVIHSAREIKN